MISEGDMKKARLNHGICGVSEIECVAGMGLRGDRYPKEENRTADGRR